MWIIYERSWFANHPAVKLFISFIDFLNTCKTFVKKLGLGKNLSFFLIIRKSPFFIRGEDTWRYSNSIECCLNTYIEYLTFHIFYEDSLSDKRWIFLGISRLPITARYVHVSALTTCSFEVRGSAWPQNHMLAIFPAESTVFGRISCGPCLFDARWRRFSFSPQTIFFFISDNRSSAFQNITIQG